MMCVRFEDADEMLSFVLINQLFLVNQSSASTSSKSDCKPEFLPRRHQLSLEVSVTNRRDGRLRNQNSKCQILIVFYEFKLNFVL